jgi:uncharacterized membrane protein
MANDPALTGLPAIHARLMPVGAALLMAALVTDLAYLKTVSVEWETFSVWLIAGGLVIAGVAALGLLVDLIAFRRRFKVSWLLLLCAVVAVLLSILNAFVHSRDGYTAVQPTGLTLSIIVTALLIVLGINGWSVLRVARYVKA